jgi:hypothetical protein
MKLNRFFLFFFCASGPQQIGYVYKEDYLNSLEVNNEMEKWGED